MIDTIVLSIPQDTFSIRDHNRFNPSTENLYNSSFYRLGSRSHFSCVQNPTKGELRQGIYKPRLTITKRMRNGKFQILLKIEFSIPKLLFGNNFDELEESDFQNVRLSLQNKLNNMGVFILEDELARANVSAIHFSKNIILQEYWTPFSVLRELSKIDLNHKLDLNQTNYRNEGHCLKFHSNSFEIAFYDKKRDLAKAEISEKRAIENDNSIQFDLFKEKKKILPFEVLRIEVRLNNRTKIKKVLKTLEIQNDFTFRSLFQKDISKNVLFYILSNIENDYSLLSYKPKNSKDFLIDLKIMNPDVKIRKSLQLLGLKMAIEEMGIREFRELIKHSGNTNWYRLKKEYSTMKLPCQKSNIISVIENALNEFQPLRLQDSLSKNLLHIN